MAKKPSERRAPQQNVIQLPDPIRKFCRAHRVLKQKFAQTGLTFTLDGKLVGDIAEVIAAKMFDLTLCPKRTSGVDARTRNGRRSIQIKSTGKPKAGPAFSPGKGFADHLLFFRINFSEGTAELAYNGPEAPIRALLPPSWNGTKRVSLAKVLSADAKVKPNNRLRLGRRMNAGT